MEKSTKVVTGKVRFSYVEVFQPRAMEEGQEPRYSVSIIIPKKDKKTIAKIEEAIENVIEANKAKFTKNGKRLSSLQLPLRDGDEDERKSDDPAYAGAMFLNAKSKRKPGVVDEDLNPIMEASEFYSGCYGRASISFYAFDKNGNKGVACSLNNLQKLEDGESLGSVSTPENDFGDELM